MSEPIHQILQRLADNRSRKTKIKILEENKDNELLQRVLRMALLDNITFYIKQIPPFLESVPGVIGLEQSLNQLALLQSRSVTGDAAKVLLTKVLENSIPEERSTIIKIIQKDLKCGIQAATVNEVWGKQFIPSFPVMLAESYKEKNLKNIKYPAFGQVKSDGMRITIIKNDKGRLTFFSRNGKEFLVGARWVHLFNHLPNGIVVDGEALVLLKPKDGKNPQIADRKTGNGILNKILQGTASGPEIDSVAFVVWDVIPYQSWLAGKSERNYQQRFNLLNELWPKEKEIPATRVKIAQTWTVEDEDMAAELFDYVLQCGGEGIILKNKAGIWEDKRSKDQVKMKAERDADLVVTDWFEGSGQFEGMMGSLEAQTADGMVVVNIGSGFTEQQRRDYTSEKMIGRIITVKYNEIISDKKKKQKSMFLPIFVELREDKDKANNLGDLK